MQLYDYDKDEIKQTLTIEQVYDFLSELGGEPEVQQNHETIVSKTICHGGSKRRLYYYDNTKLFRCFTDCADSFDIFELTKKVKSLMSPKLRITKEGTSYLDEWNLPESIEYVAQYFNFSPKEKQVTDGNEVLEDWKVLSNYNRISKIDKKTQVVELKIYDDRVLKNLPRPKISPWIEENITQQILDRNNICYDAKNCGIVIPHYDTSNQLVGIRERTLIKEEEIKGKYRPAYINGQLYNHPLSFNLYNLNNSKDNIAKIQKVFIFESEKSCLKYASYFGSENDISVAVCGSSLISYQVDLLIKTGAKELIVAFDREGSSIDKTKYVKKFYDMKKKYGNLINLSFMYDKNGEYLDFKDSPIDNGKEVFLELFKRRIIL